MPTPPNLALAFGLPPERAVEYFAAKGLRITSTWRDLPAAAHAGSFTVAGVLKAEVLGDIRSALDSALASGQTFPQFLQALKPQLKAKGWWGIAHDPETGEVIKGRAMTPHRLRTVFQTNLQSSYMAGRYKAQSENADRRPYWQYVAILDNRTRPRHRALNGRIFRHDDAAWGVLYPPNGYNCRCRVKALSQSEIDAEGGALSVGEGRMETVDVDLGGKRGTMPVTGYRDPGTNKMFLPDPGFDNNPGAGYGRDIALARRVQELKSRDLRTQVWQALNNSPERLKAWQVKVDEVTATRGLSPRPRLGDGATVIGFVDEAVAGFARRMNPGVEPTRVLAMPHKRLLHADSVDHQVEGIALTPDQYLMLPGILARPDAVYWDREVRNLAFVRHLVDGSLIYVPVTPAYDARKVGRIDALVNAYRLLAGKDGAGRLAGNAGRFVRMAEEKRGAP